MRKTISPTMHLKVVALFHMAHHHYREGAKYDQELCRLLQAEDRYGGCISDQMFEDNPDLDNALKNEGIKVLVKSPKCVKKPPKS